jgi:hypothetical protein
VRQRGQTETAKLSREIERSRLITQLERLSTSWQRRIDSAARLDGPGLTELRKWSIDLQDRAEDALLLTAAEWLADWNRETEPGGGFDAVHLRESLGKLSELLRQMREDATPDVRPSADEPLKLPIPAQEAHLSTPPVAATQPPPFVLPSERSASIPSTERPLCPELEATVAAHSPSFFELAAQSILHLRAFGRTPRAKGDCDPTITSTTAEGSFFKAFSRHPASSLKVPKLLLGSLPPLPRDIAIDPVEKRKEQARRTTSRVPRLQTPARRWDSWVFGALIPLVVGALVFAGMIAWGRLNKAKREAGGDPPETNRGIAPATPPGASAPARGVDRADENPFKEMLDHAHRQPDLESPELSAWVDEQAALQAKLLDTGRCEGSQAACAILFKNRHELPAQRGKRIAKPDSSGSRAVQSGWLHGLKMPTIPVADNEHVHRAFLKFTDTTSGRERFESLLFHCGAYSELIRAKLAKYELPESLLAVVYAESGCRPAVTSNAGASGLWQFMPEAAKAYHLDMIEGVIDERWNPPKSTEAAVRFLADLYKRFRSWELALAAYNMGPYGVSGRLHQAGEEADFWALFEARLLPEETAQYVPTIEAFAVILANLRSLNFGTIQTLPPEETIDFEPPPNTRLGLVANAASTSTSRIRELNPQLMVNFIPDMPGKRVVVRLPKKAIWSVKEKLEDLIKSGSMDDTCVSDDFDWGGKVKSKGCAKPRRETQPLGPAYGSRK